MQECFGSLPEAISDESHLKFDVGYHTAKFEKKRGKTMKVYNTLSKQKEEFVPLQEGKVSMYVCGPTVYNLIHIGNARPMIVFDTVRRYLEHKGYEVNYVSNFTDVDDKIIAKANEEGVTAKEISERYIAECKKDMAGMNVKPATTHPLATQEIDGMIDMIQTLIDKEYAYPVADGTVYFRVKKFKEYGKLSHKNLDEITGCTEHKELGSSSDGKYKYYLSTNKDADEKLTKELEKIKTDITEMTPYQNISVFDQPQDTSSNPEDVKSVGKFETTGIDGKTYTEKVFSDYDLTLVNVFTTWCSPCVKEIPELQELYKEMKEKGVGVAGVVLDTTDEKGNQDEEAVKKAGILQEKTKAEYPFLMPDTTMMNGRLQGISAFPETFFVDKDGNIVGDTYTGSHTLDEWKEIVEKELKNVSK